MKKTNKFSPEVRERAVSMVQEQRGEYPSLWAAIASIALKIGCVSQTLHEWVKRTEVDAGKREGITIRGNKWLWFIILGTLTGAASALYDKFLIAGINRMAVQCYYSFYQTLMLVPLTLIFWFPAKRKGAVFQWRWSIPLIGIFLVVADFLYFYAISLPGSLIALISPLRRSNAIVSFALAAILFKEKNIWRKALLLAGITCGIAIIIIGSLG